MRRAEGCLRGVVCADAEHEPDKRGFGKVACEHILFAGSGGVLEKRGVADEPVREPPGQPDKRCDV